jgi:hypothetical protein
VSAFAAELSGTASAIGAGRICPMIRDNHGYLSTGTGNDARPRHRYPGGANQTRSETYA